MHFSTLTKSALLQSSEYHPPEQNIIAASAFTYSCWRASGRKVEHGFSLLYGFQLNPGAFSTTSCPAVTPSVVAQG